MKGIVVAPLLLEIFYLWHQHMLTAFCPINIQCYISVWKLWKKGKKSFKSWVILEIPKSFQCDFRMCQFCWTLHGMLRLSVTGCVEHFKVKIAALITSNLIVHSMYMMTWLQLKPRKQCFFSIRNNHVNFNGGKNSLW